MAARAGPAPGHALTPALRRWRRWQRAAGFALALALGSTPARAGSVADGLCGQPPALDAAQHDRLLRFAAVVHELLEAEAPAAAIVSRSGLDLSRFGLRYSHAGLALAAGAGSRWAVRQLYYDCQARQPQLYDQGLAGFVAGTHAPDRGFVSLLLPPQQPAATLAATALDRPLALRLLGARYNAVAHAWSLDTQNCNQWLAELIASAEGGLVDGAGLRARAQDWLRAAGYVPAEVDVGSHALMFAAGFIPWVRLDDRPEAERYTLRLQLSLPQAIEAFARRRWPQARRIEICHAEGRVVIRRDGPPLAADCRAQAGDESRPL